MSPDPRAFPRLGEVCRRAPGFEGWPRQGSASIATVEPSSLDTWPTISVVTPCLDMLQFLEDAIGSVKRQNYPRVEHIVMDGGSRDGTVEYLKAQSNVIWASEPDGGQSDAVNQGFGRATGEIIGWLNADDFYEPNCLREVAAFFFQHPKVDVLYGDCYYLYEDSGGRELRLVKAREFNLDALANQGCYIPQPATLFRRSVLETKLLDHDLRFAMDYEWWLRLARAGKTFAYLPIPLATFRITDTSKSGTSLVGFWPEVRQVSRRHGGRFFSPMLFHHFKKSLSRRWPTLYRGVKSIYSSLRGRSAIA